MAFQRSLSPTKDARPINSSTLTPGEFSTFQFHLTHIKLLVRWEFGGPWGVTAMMIGFPMLMYYLWICLWFYDGQLVIPKSVGGIKPFIHEMWAHIRDVSLSIGRPSRDSIISPPFSCRMPAQTPMRGRCIPVSFFTSSFSLGSCLAICKRACLCHLLVTKLSCTTAMLSSRSTLPSLLLQSSTTITSSASQKSSTTTATS